MKEQILTLIATYLPDILTMFVAVFALYKTFRATANNFTNIKNYIKSNVDLSHINKQLDRVVSENYELKRQIKELISQLKRIKVDDINDQTDKKV